MTTNLSVPFQVRFNKSNQATRGTVRSESSDAFSAGERIAKLSVVTLLSIGLVQIPVGLWTGSLGLTADGVDSISDSLVSLIVWVGLHFSRRRPDARFHFGYQILNGMLGDGQHRKPQGI